jgi:hypothetical protein
MRRAAHTNPPTKGIVMPASSHSYGVGNFQFNLDGINCGFLKSVDGGGVFAEVITEPLGQGYFPAKHIGQPRYEDFTVQFGSSANRALFDWIAASWAGNHIRKDGSIIAGNHKLEAISQREFFNTLITETTIPSADAASKTPAFFTLKFAPEYTRHSKPSGKITGAAGKVPQKLWLPANFRLTLGGLDCTKVSKVDAFTVKQMVVTDDIGDARDNLREPGKLEFPNLRVTLPESGAQSWFDWFEDFLIKGNNDAGREKNGSLALLSSNRQEELARVDFFNVGIFRLAPDKAEANSDQIRRVTAELYCERMELKIAGSSPKPAGGPKAMTTRPRRRGVAMSGGSSARPTPGKILLGKNTGASLSAAAGPG